jgi:hypothetical protein
MPVLNCTIKHKLNREDKDGFLNIIYKNAIKLQTLINDILEVTRIESNTLYSQKGEIQFDRCDIKHCAGNCQRPAYKL